MPKQTVVETERYVVMKVQVNARYQTVLQMHGVKPSR